MFRHSRPALRRGLTLIELVVVIAILAVLATLVIPKLGFLQGRAANAGTAATAAQLVSNIETFRTSAGSYPTGFDTLLEEGTTVYSKLWQHTVAPTVNIGIRNDLEAVDTNTTGLGVGSWTTSLGHAFAANASGNILLYDHVVPVTGSDFNNSATTVRTLTSLSNAKLAYVKTTASSVNKAMGYPTGALPAGVRLLAFGIGPNTNLQEILASPPRHPEQSKDYYGRYIAVFAVYANGKPAQLRGVLDSYGASIDSNVASYNTAAVDASNAP